MSQALDDKLHELDKKLDRLFPIMDALHRRMDAAETALGKLGDTRDKHNLDLQQLTNDLKTQNVAIKKVSDDLKGAHTGLGQRIDAVKGLTEKLDKWRLAQMAAALGAAGTSGGVLWKIVG